MYLKMVPLVTGFNEGRDQLIAEMTIFFRQRSLSSLSLQ